MAEPQGTTFSVIVLAFPGNGEDVVRSLSQTFGIGAADAAAIIERAPVRVKKGVDAATAKQLASQLLAIGADLSIRNEVTGEEKTYSASERDKRRASSPRTSTASAVPEPATASAPPSVAPGAGERRPDAATSLMEALRVARDRTESVSSIRPAPRVSSSGPISAHPPPRISAPPASDAGAEARRSSGPLPIVVPPPVVLLDERQPSEPPVPPPAEPLKSMPDLPPPPEAGPSVPLAKCGSCGRFSDKNAKCIHCGWSNEGKKRHCRSCGKEVPLASGLPRAVWGGLFAGGAVIGAVIFWYLGALAGLAGPLLAAGVGLVLDGTRLHYRCVGCRRDVETSWLQPIEKTRLGRARAKWIAYGAFFALLAVGLAAPASARTTTMYIDSFGIGYTVTLPRSRTEHDRRVLTASTEFGPARVVALVSTSPREAIHTYALLHLVLPRETKPNVDDAALERLLAQAIERLVPQAKIEKTEPARLGDATGRVMSFQGDYEGKKVHGRARGFKFTSHEIAVAVVLAASPAAAEGAGSAEFLGSLVPGPKPR